METDLESLTSNHVLCIWDCPRIHILVSCVLYFLLEGVRSCAQWGENVSNCKYLTSSLSLGHGDLTVVDYQAVTGGDRVMRVQGFGIKPGKRVSWAWASNTFLS